MLKSNFINANWTQEHPGGDAITRKLGADNTVGFKADHHPYVVAFDECVYTALVTKLSIIFVSLLPSSQTHSLGGDSDVLYR